METQFHSRQELEVGEGKEENGFFSLAALASSCSQAKGEKAIGLFSSENFPCCW